MVINNYKFNEQVETIKKNIRDYEFIVFNTVSIAKNLSYYWNDGYTKSFFSEIDKEIEYTNDLIYTLYRLCSSLTLVSAMYNDIGEKEKNLLGFSSNIIDLNNFIVQEDIDNEDVISKKQYLYNKTISTEEIISVLLSKIDVPFTRKLYFDNLSVQKEDPGFIGMLSGIDNEIKKLELNIESVKNNSDLLKISLYNITESYSSNNSETIKNIVEKIESELHTLYFNFEKTVGYIQTRKSEYKNMLEDLAQQTRKIENTD